MTSDREYAEASPSSRLRISSISDGYSGSTAPCEIRRTCCSQLALSEPKPSARATCAVEIERFLEVVSLKAHIQGRKPFLLLQEHRQGWLMKGKEPNFVRPSFGSFSKDWTTYKPDARLCPCGSQRPIGGTHGIIQLNFCHVAKLMHR